MKGLIDSTLREGSQTFGLTFSPAQKREIFAGLCSTGIEEIEIGVASALDEGLPELMAFCRAHDRGRRLALWCRCRREDILFARTLMPDVLSLSVPVSDLHIEKKFGRDRGWALATAKAAVREAQSLGFKAVSLGLEDATRADRSFLQKMAGETIAAGLDRLRLADTVGIATPLETVALVQSIKAMGPVEVGVHMHNDFGMATANSLAALDAGADWADVTILGLGERAGNAHLEDLSGYLALRRNRKYDLKALAELAMQVARASNRTIAPHSPIIGENIFSCETGLHLQGLAKDTTTYEPFPPEMVGAERRLRFGGKIGRKEVRGFLEGMKPDITDLHLEEMVQAIRRKAKNINRPLRENELTAIIATAFQS